MGEIDNRPSERVQRLRAALEKVKVTVNVPDNIHGWLWGKFILAAALGGVGAVVQVPIGVWRQIPQVRDMTEHAAHEIVAVAVAKGVQPPAGIVDQVKGAINALPPAHMTSLQEDVVVGRPSELEYWTGAVVRLGQEVGVPTPVNEFIYHSVLPRETQARGQLSPF